MFLSPMAFSEVTASVQFKSAVLVAAVFKTGKALCLTWGDIDSPAHLGAYRACADRVGAAWFRECRVSGGRRQRLW
jgi:hypothetical protein